MTDPYEEEDCDELEDGDIPDAPDDVMHFLNDTRANIPLGRAVFVIVEDERGFLYTAGNVNDPLDMVDLLSKMTRQVVIRMVEEADDEEYDFESN